jgi:DNA repair exonuclease SbcCD ATPase subunit
MTYTLKLKNFKCFTDYTVNIPFSSLILFNGKSGAGKSSLIQAFIFVITGEGKKLYKYGTKSLQVTLEFERDDQKYKIIRKKGPESLELNINASSYEDDEAQARINSIFGENFIISSVIKQKGEASFLLSSNRDKMTFLESILFSKTDLEKKKNIVKEKQKVLKDSHQKTISQKEILDNLITSKSSTSFNNTVISMSETISQSSDLIIQEEDYIRSISLKKEQLLVNIEATRQEIEEVTNIINKKEEIIARNQKLGERITELQEELSSIKKVDQDSIRDELDRLNKRLSLVRLQKEKENLLNKIETTKATLLEKARNELQEISSKLNNNILETFDDDKYKLYTKQRELLLERKKIKSRLDELEYEEEKQTVLNEKKKELEKKIKIRQDKIENIKIFQTCLTCPHCKKFVRYIDKNLVEANVNVEKDIDIKSLEKEKQSFEKEYTTLSNDIRDQETKQIMYEKYNTNISDIEKRLTTTLSLKELMEELTRLDSQKLRIESQNTLQKEYTDKKAEIEREILLLEKNKHKSISALFSKYDTLCQQVKDIDDNSLSEEDLTYKIRILSIEEKESEMILTRISDIKTRINRLKSQLQDEENIEDYKESHLILVNKLERLNEDKNDIDSDNLGYKYERISLLKERIKYLEFTSELETLNKKLEEKVLYELDLEKKIRMCSAILEGFDLTESKMLSKFIDTINHNLAVHLDAFFSEPITVTVKAFKDGKKGETKPLIDIEIIYKGNEVDVSNLSGGEYDRLNLAFSVTFNCLSSSNILILDESLASINQELAGDIITHLKEHCTDKVIWMTQHQAITGMFDRVHEII